MLKNTHIIEADEATGIQISNSTLVTQDTSAIIITKTDANPKVINSSIFVPDGQVPITSELAGSKAEMLGGYANQTDLDTDVTITVHPQYGQVFGIWHIDLTTAGAGQDIYTVSTSKLPVNGANIIVIINGLEQIEGASEHYTYVAPTGVVTFNTPFTGGEKVKIRWYD